jgi:hypothetical protein
MHEGGGCSRLGGDIRDLRDKQLEEVGEELGGDGSNLVELGEAGEQCCLVGEECERWRRRLASSRGELDQFWTVAAFLWPLPEKAE